MEQERSGENGNVYIFGLRYHWSWSVEADIVLIELLLCKLKFAKIETEDLVKFGMLTRFALDSKLFRFTFINHVDE